MGNVKRWNLYLAGHPSIRYLKEIERYVGGVRLKDVHPTERGKSHRLRGLVITRKVMVAKRDESYRLCTRWMTVPGVWK